MQAGRNGRVPSAVSRLGSEETSRDVQDARAVQWLRGQPGAELVVITPRREFGGSDLLHALVGSPNVIHLAWKALNLHSLEGRRVLLAWPNRQTMQDVWGAHPAALAVIEHAEEPIAEWITYAKPLQLLPGETVTPPDEATPVPPLPNGVDKILSSVAGMAAAYSSGLKWDEEDKLKSDMMRRPERWGPITVEQVRTTCHELGMRPKDVDTIAGFLQRRKDGHRFNVTGSYRGFTFAC